MMYRHLIATALLYFTLYIYFSLKNFKHSKYKDERVTKIDVDL